MLVNFPIPRQHTKNQVHDEEIAKNNKGNKINPRPRVPLHIGNLKYQ